MPKVGEPVTVVKLNELMTVRFSAEEIQTMDRLLTIEEQTKLREQATATTHLYPALQELVRLKKWRDDLASMEEHCLEVDNDETQLMIRPCSKTQMKKWLWQYGVQKEAAWKVAFKLMGVEHDKFR